MPSPVTPIDLKGVERALGGTTDHPERSKCTLTDPPTGCRRENNALTFTFVPFRAPIARQQARADRSTEREIRHAR